MQSFGFNHLLKHMWLALLACWPLSACAQAPEAPPKSWAVYYSNDLPAETFLRFDLLVFDHQAHPTLRPLIQRGKTVLGYLSAGEVQNDPARGYYAELDQLDLLIKSDTHHTAVSSIESTPVDIRHPEWARLIVEEMIPALLRQGFDGVMLDTIDSSVALEEKDPVKYAGMKQAAIHLIKAIRMNYPHIKIMLNRGLEIIPAIEQDVDYILAESIHTTYDFKTQKHGLVKDSYYESIAKYLKDAQVRAPHLQVVSLDYWDMKDEAGVKKIYEAQRKHGFVPYVTHISLHQLTPEPK